MLKADVPQAQGMLSAPMLNGYIGLCALSCPKLQARK